VNAPAEYREWLRQRAVFDDAAFAEYVTVEGQVFPRHLREASRFADAHDQGMVADPGLTAQACRVATSSAASTSAVERTRPIRAKTVRIVCACSSGLRAAMASSTNTCS